MTRRGKVYTPQRSYDAMEIVKAAYRGPLFEGPLKLECDFYYDHSVITICEHPGILVVSTLRGDTSNYVKLVEDALNGIAYADDKSIVEIHAAKYPKEGK
jgi:Holliday junction resolvase RusA-like endonuclease